MAFAFAGAQRTGKTTLAKKVAEDLGMHYFDASTTKLMQEGGFNAVSDMPIEQRIEAQEFLLKRFLQNLSSAPRPLIADRTPLDMIGYMLGEITMHNSSVELGARADAYVRKCLEATVSYFDTIIILGPLPTFEVDPAKPPPNRAYQRAVQFLIEGAAAQVHIEMNIERIDETDLEVRRTIAGALFEERLADLATQAKQANLSLH